MLPIVPIAVVAGGAIVWRRFYPSAQEGDGTNDPTPDPGATIGKAQFQLPTFKEMMKWARTGDLHPICAIIDEQGQVASALGYSLPAGWDKWPCEVKIVFAAPVGIGELIVGAAKAVQGWNAVAAKPAAKVATWVRGQAGRTVDTTVANATHTNTTVGTHGTTIAGHRIL